MAGTPMYDPDMVLADIMSRWPATVPIFMRNRMSCVGCLVSPFHTIDDACDEYGLDATQFEDDLRDAIRQAGFGRSE